jgi:hypothetical protein
LLAKPDSLAALLAGPADQRIRPAAAAAAIRKAIPWSEIEEHL